VVTICITCLILYAQNFDHKLYLGVSIVLGVHSYYSHEQVLLCHGDLYITDFSLTPRYLDVLHSWSFPDWNVACIEEFNACYTSVPLLCHNRCYNVRWIIETMQLHIMRFTTQSLTEMSTRNNKIIMFLGSKVRLVRMADNLIAIYEPIV
jgi:hypothetical protein